jgi:hypothetical protein
MMAKKYTHTTLFWMLVLLQGCNTNNSDIEEMHKVSAETFFRGIYGGDPSVVSELGVHDIALSYPIFQTLFNSPVVIGHDAVTNFVERFSTKWKDTEITIEEAIAEDNTVVLVWSFRARDAFFDPSGGSSSDPVKSWGGITVYHFNQEGKITSEFGEESEPGPTGRLSKSSPQKR